MKPTYNNLCLVGGDGLTPTTTKRLKPSMMKQSKIQMFILFPQIMIDHLVGQVIVS